MTEFISVKIPCSLLQGTLQTITMLKIFKELDWLAKETYQNLYSEAEQIGKMLSTLAKTI